MKKVLYPGSFDPITYGHMNVISQALNTFDEVVVCILKNASKNNGWFSLSERKEIIEKIYENNPKVHVICVEEKRAVVDVAIENGCFTQIRGLRNVTDFAEEIERARINYDISDKKVNTVAFFAEADTSLISSSAVKEVYSLNKSITKFVHPYVIECINKKFGGN